MIVARQSLESSFTRCQRRGWYAMHDAPNKPRKGVERGATVHAILDARARGNPTPREADPQDARVADALAALVNPGWKYLGSEISFGPVAGPGFDIEGTIDALYLSPMGCEPKPDLSVLVIVDRKTLAALPAKSRRDIRAIGPQPYYYSWAVCSEYEIAGVAVEYHYARRPAKNDQPAEPIKTCTAIGWLSSNECLQYLVRRSAPIVTEMERVRKLPVWSAQPNLSACFDFGGCAYRQVCSYGFKKEMDK